MFNRRKLNLPPVLVSGALVVAVAVIVLVTSDLDLSLGLLIALAAGLLVRLVLLGIERAAGRAPDQKSAQPRE